MMHHLREFGQGFVAKILLGALVLMFGFWGIGDIFRSGGARHSVATVGRASVSLVEYQQQLQRRKEELHQMLGEGYSPELVKHLHLEDQVLSSMINSRLFEQEAADEGIVVNDATVADAIRRKPLFFGADGKFDKATYEARLKSEGVAEPRYIQDLRQDLQVGVLSDVWGAGSVVPESLVEALYQARAQQRIVDISLFSPDSLKDVPTPTEQEIKSYYDDHAKQFAIPEYRAVRLIVLSPADIAAKINISDAEVAHEYEERKQEFFAPEHRDVEQLLFATEAEAKAAAAASAKGKRFSDIATRMHALNKDKVALGKVSRQELPAEVAGPVFALSENGVTAPIQTEFGWNLFHVIHIEPAGQQSLEKVHDLLLGDMRGKQAQDAVYHLMGQLQDALAGGESVESAAEKLGAKVQTFPPLSHAAQDEKGKQYTLPSQTAVLGAAFSLNEKDNSSPIQTDDGGVIIVHVDSIIPERIKPLEDVKAQVTDGWNKDKRQALLRSKMDAVVEHMHAGKTLAEALEQEHIKATITVPAVKLAHESTKFNEAALAKTPLSPVLVSDIFHLAPKQSTRAVPLGDGTFCVATLEQVIAAPDVQKNPDTKALAAVRTDLKDGLTNETLGSYLKYLRTKYKVTVNTDLIEHVQNDEGAQ